jgi:hypothetical protein
MYMLFFDNALASGQARSGPLRIGFSPAMPVIHKLGGTMLENLPVAESIKKLESREKKRIKAGQRKISGEQG